MKRPLRGWRRGLIVLALHPALAWGASDVDVDPSEGELGLGLVPKVAVNSDDGLGLGLRGTAYWYRWGQRPYKTALSFQAFITTRLVQHHFLRLDAVDAFNLPFRLQAEIGYYQSRSQNFCGFASAATCDPALAQAAAERRSLNPVQAATFKQQFYKVRFFRPYASTSGRLRLFEVLSGSVEAFSGWRGHFYYPGDWTDDDKDGAPDLYPFPGSFYAQAFPAGEAGLASVLQAGVVYDARDNEPAPREGVWAEASIRGAAPYWLSAWSYAGINATLHTYVPLTRAKNVVLASRYVGDALVGDAPLQEMIRVGGTADYTAFGGMDMGRGIRVQRYPGRLKLLMQQEVRYEFPSFTLFDQDIRFGLAAFVDAGWIGEDLAHLGPDPLGVHIGTGGSLRVAWNENFIMRLDVAVSRDEGFTPLVYSGPNHPF